MKNFIDRWIRAFGGFGELGVVVVGIVGVRVVIRAACLVIGIKVRMSWSGGRLDFFRRVVFALFGCVFSF